MVIGSGVAGLAVARALAASGRYVVVLETEKTFGAHASSHNSEVIHAGIYYPPASLKAKTCVRGKRLLLAYCRERQINHKVIGKILVASSEHERIQIAKLAHQAMDCGVGDLRYLDKAELRELEPELRAVNGFFSPSSGIVDSHHLMASYLGDLQRLGGALVLNSPVTDGNIKDKVQLELGGGSDCTLECRVAINCAGAWAPELARQLGVAAPNIPRAYFARGQYYALAGSSPFKHLIYPVPSSAGLGIHYTLDLGGTARFGPDVQWVHKVDYAFDNSKETAFRDAISRYYPGIQERSLTPGHTGIRAKIVGPGQRAADFQIDSHAFKNGKGLINLYGIESPGLTASMALAEYVAELVKHQ